MELDAGVAEIVGLLNAKGLVTTLSCAGHPDDGKPHAWFRIEAAHFKGYVARHPRKMKRFLLAGEGRWSVSLVYAARSRFRGLGSPRPRLANMRRVVAIDLDVTLVLHTPKAMRALERAARQCL